MREARELRYLILALQREGNRLFAAGLRPLGLTPSQAEVLSVLADHQSLTLSGLGELLVCDSGTNPSRLAERLVAAGLVRREPATTDRRQILLSLTPEGAELAKQVATVETELEDELAELVGDKPIAGALDLLRSLAAPFPAGQALQRRRY